MAYVDPALEARLSKLTGKPSPYSNVKPTSTFSDPALERRIQQLATQPRRQQPAPQPIAQSQPIIAKPRLDPKKEALKFGANTALNLASTISKATQFATSTIGKQLLDTITKKNPVTAVASLAVPKQYKKLNDQWKDYIRKNEQKLPAAQVTKAVEKLSKNEYLQPSREWQQAQQTDWKNIFTKEHLPETILQVSPSIVSSILTAITIGPSGLFVTTAGSTAQDVKSDAMNFGVPEGKAETLGLATGLVVGYLDKALPDKLFGDPSVKQAFLKGMLRKLGNSVLLEAGTETTQEAVQLAAEKTFRNDLGWDEVAVRTALSAFGGALGGGAMQTVASVFNRTRQEVINDDQTMLDYLKETKGSSTLTPQQAIGTIVGTPLENTPEGKAVMKTALEAQEQGKQVKITTSEGSVKAEIVEATQPVIEENKQLIQEELAKIQPEESPENQDNTALTSEGKSSEEISEPSRVISSTPGTLEKVDDFLSKIAARSISFSTKTLKISPSDLKKAGNLLMSITKNPSQLVEVYTRVKQVSNEYEDLLGTLPGNPQIQIDIKTPESMVSKVIRNNLQGKKNYTLKDVNDALRGRAIYETEAEIEEVKNTWETAPYIMNYFDTPHYTGYRGLHYGLNFDGQMAEVQIHTPVSLKLDKILRPIYEAYRTSTEGIPIKIIESMRKVADSFYAESITEAEANDQISELLAQKQQKTVEKSKVTPKKAPVSKKPDTKQELQKVYKENQQAVEEALSQVWTELDASQAGSRIVVDGETQGIKSTFPSWIPDDLKSRKLFDKALANLATILENPEYPPTSKPKLRDLFDAILDQVDYVAEIDTRSIRNQLLETDNEKTNQRPNKAIAKKDDSSPERAEAAIEKQQKAVKKAKRPTSNSSRAGDANVDTFQDLPIIDNEKQSDKAVTVPFPEMVALANELMNKYPTVHVKPGKKFGGQVNGLFLSRGDGEIRLNAALFADVNQAAKTLAHEMGHLADYIPDKTLKRGNLLGRIGSMTKFMRGFFTNVEVEEEIDTLVAERKATQEARKLLPPKESRSSADKEKDKGYLADIRQINKEIKKLQENAIKNKDVFKELWALSKQWRPLQQQQTMINATTGKPEIVMVEITEEQADDEYLSYRKSSRELYADALSVLLNDPQRIRESAPTFWSKFIEQLDRKPILKENLFATWDLLNEPQDVILERRLNQIYKGYSAAKAKRADILNEQKPKRPFIERVMQNHITVFDPIYRKLDKQFKDTGVVTSPKAKLRMQLEEMQMRRNESYLYIDSMINDISTPLKEIGLSEDDLGALLQLERGLGDRKDIANPYGLQGNFSQETLDYLQTYLQKHRSISAEQFNVLQQVAKKFREYTFSKVEAAAEVGVYSQKFFNETAKPNKDTYATYQVIEYIHDNYVSAGIKHAVGTVKPIENPVVSTLLKTMAVIEQIELQKGKLAVIDELRTNFPGDISDAKAIRPQGVRVGWRQEKNRVSLEYYKDGAKAAVNVDPYIAQMFEVYTPTEMHTAVKVSSAFNRFFKPLVTTYNLSWGFYSNIIRDTKRTYKNLGAILPTVGKKQGVSMFEYMYRWVNSIPEGKNFQKHKITPLLKEMLANKAFSMPFTGYDSMANEAEWLKPIIKRYAPLGDDAKQTGFKSKVLRPITKIFKGIEYVGSVMETTSKVAGYQIVKKRLESGREAGFITRNYVGTPNYIDGGTQKQIDNNILVFSNVMLQALRNDIEIATNPTTKSGYWFKTMQVDILPKLIMLAGAAGLFGEIVKEIYSKATEYDKTNYIIVPLGMRANGKASYLRIPQDETGRLFSAIVWKLGTYMMGDLKKPNQVISLMAGFLPSTTPVWTIGGGWLNFIQGRNPYDDYRGRLVIDDTTWSAGGIPRITKMVQWTLGSAGVWQFDTYDDATDTTTDFLLKSIPIINRAIKSTDYGLTEKEQQVEKELDKQSAQRILKERKLLQNAINTTRSNPDQKYEVGKQLIRDVLGETIENSTDKRRRTNLIKKYEIGLLKGSVSREMDSLIEADNNAYKLELLKLYKRTLPASDYYNLKKTAVDNKVISDDLRKEYLKMGL